MHVICVSPADCVEITTGTEFIKEVKGFGPALKHAFCSECGSGLYQWTDAFPMKTFYPTTFWYQDSVSTAGKTFAEADQMTRYVTLAAFLASM